MKQLILKIFLLTIFTTILSFQSKAQFNLYMKNTSTGSIMVRVYDNSLTLLYTTTYAGGATGYVASASCTTGVPNSLHLIDATGCLTDISVNFSRALSPTTPCDPPPGTCCATNGSYFTSARTTSSSCFPVTWEVNILVN